MEDVVTIPAETYQEIQAVLKECRTNNDKVLETLELQDKEIRFLAWQNVELKAQLATLKGQG